MDDTPPTDVGTPRDEPIPLKLRLEGLVIADVMLTCGVELASRDRFGDVFGTKNRGAVTPALIDGEDTVEDTVLAKDDPADETFIVGALTIDSALMLSSQKYSTT